MTGPATYRYLPAEMAENLRQVSITVRRPVQGRQQGQHRSPHFGASVEFAEYREYTPGDPTNLIDWSVYARSDRYVVRRFIEETNLRAYVLLDTSGSLGFRDEGVSTKIEYACTLAAGLMYVLVNQGDSVGLMLFNDGITQTFEMAAGFEGLRPQLLALEQVQARGPGNIERTLHQAAGLIRSRSLVIVISDLLQDPVLVNRGARHLYHDGHNLMILHVLDPGERRLSFGGVADLRDLETGARLTVEADEVRGAYAGAVDRYLDTLRMGFAECLTDYHLIDTRIPASDQILHLEERARGGGA